MPPSNVAEHAARAGFPNISTEAFYPGSIEGPASALDDIDFDAPIFGIINWPNTYSQHEFCEFCLGLSVTPTKVGLVTGELVLGKIKF